MTDAAWHDSSKLTRLPLGRIILLSSFNSKTTTDRLNQPLHLLRFLTRRLWFPLRQPVIRTLILIIIYTKTTTQRYHTKLSLLGSNLSCLHNILHFIVVTLSTWNTNVIPLGLEGFNYHMWFNYNTWFNISGFKLNQSKDVLKSSNIPAALTDELLTHWMDIQIKAEHQVTSLSTRFTIYIKGRSPMLEIQ